MGETVFSAPPAAEHAPEINFSPAAALLPRSDVASAPLAATEPADPYAADKGDVWLDEPVVQYLQSASLPPETSAAEVTRVKRRAGGYVWRQSKLYRKLRNSELREVPKPADRQAIVLEMHERTGHWGAKRTAALLSTKYWWTGMVNMSSTVTAECPHCQRVKTSFNRQESQLHPLSIEGFCYRWSVDLAGPFQPVTAQGNKYVMIAVEHYTKHVEAIPIPDNQSATVAYAFAHNVLARFGSCAEVVTDNGSEFQGTFHDLLTDSLIDHRFSSPLHPQANGLAERAVQTVKKALRKMASTRAAQATGSTHWDEQLPWILLGYRASPQESSKFSPMQLLYARDPVIPPAILDRMTKPLDLDNTTTAADQLLLRAEYLKQAGVVVDNNLRIAQHRDTLRYARVHGGAYLKKVFKFQEGDFVYTKVHHPTTLEPRTSPYILRVLGVRPSGVLELVGRCGTVITRHSSSCAPCHLPNIDPTIDTQLAKPIADLPCSVCGDPSREHLMVLCDGCNGGWHLDCLSPPLSEIPRGQWFCPACKFIDPELPVTRVENLTPTPAPVKRKMPQESAVAQYDGQTVRKSNRGSGRSVTGTARFLGMNAGSRCYEVKYSDGSVMSLSPSAVAILLEGVSVPHVSALLPARTPQQLPPRWLLDTYEHVRRCLTTLAPGYWTEGHITGLLMQATLFQNEPAPAYEPSNLPECVSRLVESVFLPATVRNLWSPSSSGLEVALTARGVKLLNPELGPLSPLYPEYYNSVSRDTVFVGCPSGHVVDLVMFLSAVHSHALTAVLVPTAYHLHAPAARTAALGRLARMERLCAVPCVPCGASRLVKSEWVLIFRDAATKAALMKPGARALDLASTT